MMLLSDEEGELAVKIARKVVDSYVKGEKIEIPKELPPVFNEPRGAFVTLRTHPKKELRGCIGIPMPIYPLKEAIVEAAKSSAKHDPRFLPVTPEELDKITVEVSILTPPEKLEVKDRKELPKHIRIGVDGLIVKRGFFQGLLLPQVPVEEGWDPETFLGYACMKAGLYPDAWLDEDVEVYRFSADVFEEVEPYGKIVRRKLVGEEE